MLLFEAWNAKRDAAGVLTYNENGRLIQDTLAAVFVKRKAVGFGEAYGPNRNGEWEYVSCRPDGTVVTAPSASASCAICHLQAGLRNVWTFQRDRVRWTLFAEVVNLTNRDNVRVDDLSGFNAQTGEARVRLEKTFPILPSVGMSVEF